MKIFGILVGILIQNVKTEKTESSKVEIETDAHIGTDECSNLVEQVKLLTTKLAKLEQQQGRLEYDFYEAMPCEIDAADERVIIKQKQNSIVYV